MGNLPYQGNLLRRNLKSLNIKLDYTNIVKWEAFINSEKYWVKNSLRISIEKHSKNRAWSFESSELCFYYKANTRETYKSDVE